MLELPSLTFYPFLPHTPSEAVPGALHCTRLRGSFPLGDREVTPAFSTFSSLSLESGLL